MSLLPGGTHINRYRIKGILTCRTPLHIGCGEATKDVDSLAHTDIDGMPIIPGSALRGVVRRTLAGMTMHPGDVTALLGTTEGSGKVKFEDSTRLPIVGETLLGEDVPPYWNRNRGTYRPTSVCIDPLTGAAKARLLYSMEVVPAGAKFKVVLCGWNLLDSEVAMLLAGLEAFNEPSGGVTLGAHAGRGYGRMSWSPEGVYLVGVRSKDGSFAEKARQDVWRRHLSSGALAKIDGDPVELDELPRLEQRATPPAAGAVAIPFTLTLDSGLAVRGGEKGDGDDHPTAPPFKMLTAASPRHRGEGFHLFVPGEPIEDGCPTVEVAALAMQVILGPDGQPRSQFQIPGSSLRGTARGYLARAWQDAGGKSDAIDDLFGTADKAGRIEFENGVPLQPRQVACHHEDHVESGGPGVPTRVRERGPVDRTTGAAKDGGLHHFLSVEKGTKFSGKILIHQATPADIAMLRVWKEALNAHLLSLGGVGAAGFGLASVEIDGTKIIGLGTQDPRSDLKKEVDGLCAMPAQATVPALPAATTPVVPAAALPPDPWAREPGQHPHAMSPYDFVPFAHTVDSNLRSYTPPILKTIADWEKVGQAADAQAELVSGTISVDLRALQPVHIVGRHHPEGNGMPATYSFHAEAGGAVIPGASLRGMLRAFIEARWNCWVSSYTSNRKWHTDQYGRAPAPTGNPYMRELDERYVGFNTDTEWVDYSRGRRKPPIDQAIPNSFLPPKPSRDGWDNRKVDLATFLFGAVLQERASPQASSDELLDSALRGRVRIEDATLATGQLDSEYWIPDLPGEAFLGGPKPKKSSMFYFRPGRVVRRNVRGHEMAQFIAGDFRGRKFYFHQDWRACVDSYMDPNSPSNFWAQGDHRPIKRWLECVKPDERTCFKLHFDRIPRDCVALLVTALENPGTNIKHKLGYAKPFGFGSIELKVTNLAYFAHKCENNALLRLKVTPDDLATSRQTASKPMAFGWACDAAASAQADAWLRYLLTYPPAGGNVLFAYPGYRQGEDDVGIAGFAKPSQRRILDAARLPVPAVGRPATIADAKAYWDAGAKVTLDLGLYQRRSFFFGDVCRRAERPGETLTQEIHKEAK
jgi:CRISPR/Cas system CSM-associated protein Csm3 (group 7 of RAMP superfamily)